MRFRILYVAWLATIATAGAIANRETPSISPDAAPASPTASGHKAVLAAQAIAKSRSPVSHVPGKAFNRYVTIWFENTNYETAAADPNFSSFAEKGITLEGYRAVTHPSEPNYLAAVGGDYFGLDGDPFIAVPENVSSVVDLLEDKGITWGLYQEDMPYTGYEGMDWRNEVTGANAYVRKHNPEVLFTNVVNKPERLELIKNTTMFASDLAANKLPQWSFITPNMTSDGHDSSITIAGEWLQGFLGPLLEDPHFMNNTLVLVTFDENEIYSRQNRVFSILLGDAVPKELINTTDSNYYDHYSQLATVQANWGLHTLGRFDVGANVFSYVAQLTGDKIRSWADGALENRFFNYSYPGILAGSVGWAPQPVPNTKLVVNHRTVLPAIKKYWEGKDRNTLYQGQLEIPDGLNFEPNA
ncbi:16b04893-c8a2-41ac-a81b-6f182d858b85 [Sclerotinia trifoliorum]|uniref:16b04893-c8a2-41ac-a81b-6f182d858b85 n=1 Tax=Sclerotinia trifoliorum TaxID=28548 RepID=A0A8H2ZXS1_9HELO|nr:16b04893-c8a2-41ac-a81b-6f182d858b85 [Sclerotinia trifoliorum]